jgi:hypothetical protein
MDRDPALLAELIRSAARRHGSDRTLLRLVRHCWPAGSDRTEPAAAAWLLTWGPSRTVVDVPSCACADGRCTACN